MTKRIPEYQKFRTGLGIDVFTTGRVAKICHVAPRTVSKWFDNGHLNGYRIPGSRDRRVPRDELIAFLKRNGLAVPFDLQPNRCLVVGTSRECQDALIEAVPDGSDETLVLVNDLFSAATAVVDGPYSVVVLDSHLGRSDVIRAAASILKRFPTTVLIGLRSEDDGRFADWIGFTETLSKPFRPSLLADAVCAAMGWPVVTTGPRLAV